jgi:DNA invertase Pin-like site-specific DNA recombinase
MRVGYARVSTRDQDLDLQIQALTNAGCDLIFEEKESGSKADRSELGKALEIVRAGDTLVVYKLDRLSRSVPDLQRISKMLEEKKVHLQSTTQAIDTATPMGKFFFTMLSAIAELEREQIVERTLAGLEAARKSGKKSGPKPKAEAKEVKALVQAGVSPAHVCKRLGISRATMYRLLAA